MNARIDLNLIRAAAEMLAPYRDEDEQVYLDTLDGETDAMDLLDREIAEMQADEALAEAIKAREADLRARRQRIEMRAAAHKRVAGMILTAAGLKKAERPLATISIRPGNLAVRIVCEEDIPTQMMRERVERSPDRAAIKAQIDAGEHVPGAELERGSDVVTVRVR